MFAKNVTILTAVEGGFESLRLVGKGSMPVLG